jgi:hypothetical protein
MGRYGEFIYGGDADESRRKVQIGKHLLVALVAEGKGDDYRLREKCLAALQIWFPQNSVLVASHADRSRLDLGKSGLEAVAGGFPLTPFEYRLQTELVQTIDTIETIDQVDLQNRFQELADFEPRRPLVSEV